MSTPRESSGNRLVSLSDEEAVVCLDTADEAIAVVCEMHGKWQARR